MARKKKAQPTQTPGQPGLRQTRSTSLRYRLHLPRRQRRPSSDSDIETTYNGPLAPPNKPQATPTVRGTTPGDRQRRQQASKTHDGNQLSATRPYISNDRLVDPTVNEEEVTDDTDYIFPQLRQGSDRMKVFTKAINNQSYPPAIFPVLRKGEFLIHETELDRFRTKFVKEELVLTPGTYNQGMSMDKKHLSKPWQIFNSPVLMLLSYPTMHSTKHPEYGSTRDISNPSIAMVLGKFGFYDTSPPTRQTPVLMIDLFPRRLNKQQLTERELNAYWLFKLIPKQLKEYWRSIAFQMWTGSRAKFGILFEGTVQCAYKRHA
jgi:hypothetical protein